MQYSLIDPPSPISSVLCFAVHADRGEGEGTAVKFRDAPTVHKHMSPH